MAELPTRKLVAEWLKKGWKVWDAELGEGIDMLYGVYLSEIAHAYVDGRLVEKVDA